jgi:TQXA domain-containing protein/LPXTG-motif cell wall-anchored protein
VFSGEKAVAWRRAAVAATAGAVVALIGTTPAFAADPATAQPSGGAAYGHVKLKGFDESLDVGPLFLNFDGEKVFAYCIDLHHPVAIGADYQEGSWNEAEVKNLAKVQWVLLHGFPKGDAVKLVTDAGADAAGIDKNRIGQLLYIATQVSVWHFSDGAELTGRGRGIDRTEYAVVEKVYNYLTTNATDVAEPLSELKIDPSAATATVGDKAGPFTVAGPSGDIKLTVEGGKAVDAAGNPITTVTNGGQFWLTRDGAGDVSATAKAESSHSTGRVFLFQGKQKRQKLILAGTVGDELSARVKADFTPKPETTTSATPTPSASTSASASPSASTPASPSVGPSTPAGGEGGSDGGTLPKTGASTFLVVGAGLLLLIAGAVAVLIVRRRRVSFTA